MSYCNVNLERYWFHASKLTNNKAKFSFQIRIHIFKFSIYINSVSIQKFKGETSRHLYITAVLYTTYYNTPGIRRTKINLLVLSMYDLYSCSVEILYLNLLYNDNYRVL